ncbi:recombination regulator RecX [Yersinia rohdei]|uniref:Regulatory protein RecX n=1 Tax=Yersinia rohdei TaxID=29485 RepID=A0A0U1HT14_YERRO|nr:recombination regulator RecX [Yersinia rohdei]MDN0094683.1 recombination regulator RecX [Yersinia rohdei]CNF36092.1 recombination regulator RecX [Yersinia rohdei]CNJ12545.1 recombination regulator RecX [Yersinia rohdei]CQI90343.1 recombination regulator RecX [Yersinia rohdei]CQJ61949.1 recombination regulator RecX [Yersinia rohdei]
MNDLLSRAMRLLSQRDHSESELRRKLAIQPFSAKGNWGKRGVSGAGEPVEDIDPKVVEQVIAYCYQHNWLDDSRFATSYINSRSRKGYGAQRIRSELMQKGVDKELIQAAFDISEIDWCMLAKEVAQRKFGEVLPVDWKEKAKVQRYLLYRGFFQEEIQSIYSNFDE